MTNEKKSKHRKIKTYYKRTMSILRYYLNKKILKEQFEMMDSVVTVVPVCCNYPQGGASTEHDHSMSILHQI